MDIFNLLSEYYDVIRLFLSTYYREIISFLSIVCSFLTASYVVYIQNKFNIRKMKGEHIFEFSRHSDKYAPIIFEVDERYRCEFEKISKAASKCHNEISELIGDFETKKRNKTIRHSLIHMSNSLCSYFKEEIQHITVGSLMINLNEIRYIKTDSDKKIKDDRFFFSKKKKEDYEKIESFFYDLSNINENFDYGRVHDFSERIFNILNFYSTFQSELEVSLDEMLRDIAKVYRFNKYDSIKIEDNYNLNSSCKDLKKKIEILSFLKVYPPAKNDKYIYQNLACELSYIMTVLILISHVNLIDFSGEFNNHYLKKYLAFH